VEALSLGAPQPVPMGPNVPLRTPAPAKPADRLSQLSGERQQVQSQYESQAGGIQKRMQSEQAAGDALEVPKREAMPTFEHKGMSSEELGDAAKTMFALAAIGGLMTRAPMTTALNAFSSGIKGLKEGDQALFDRESKVFQQNFKMAIEKNANAMEDYKLAFQKHRGNMQDLMNEWSLIAKKHGDSVSAINMERQDIQAQLRHIESLAKMDASARTLDARLGLEVQKLNEQRRYHDIQARLGADRVNAMLAGIQARQQKGAGSMQEAKQRVTNNLGTLAGYYQELYQMGAAIDVDSSSMNNLVNSLAASKFGQAMGSALGTQAQSVRNMINQIRPLLLNDIRQASEMGARGLDSNKELEFYLQAATDPARDIQTNIAAIAVLDKAYGLGTGIVADPKAVKALVGEAPKADGPGFPKTPSTTGPGVGAFSDPEKERRYQEWKRSQGQ
jgi:hypothetical protein